MSDQCVFREIFARLQDCMKKMPPVTGGGQLRARIDELNTKIDQFKMLPLGYLDGSYIQQAKSVVNELVSVLSGVRSEDLADADEAATLTANVSTSVERFEKVFSEIGIALQEPLNGKWRMKWFGVSIGALCMAGVFALFSQPARLFYLNLKDVVRNLSWCGRIACGFVSIAILLWLVCLSGMIKRWIISAYEIFWGWRWKICVPLSWKCNEYRPMHEDVRSDDIAKMLRLYFESSNTDYALMINGAWGSGKTYYVQNSIDNLLQQGHKKSLYVSLNGVRSFDEVVAQIVFSTRWSFMGKFANSVIFPLAAKWLPEKTVAFLCSQLKNGSEAKALSSELHGEYDLTPGKYVIIIDDIERVSDEGDEKNGQSLMNLLGRLFDEFISKGYHVVFIGAESEMGAKPRFFKEKEKYIRHTISFVPDIDVVIDSLVATYSGVAGRHAKLASKFLKRFSVVYRVDNVRTIKRILEGFVILAGKVNNEVVLSKSADKILEILSPTVIERVAGVFCGKSIDDILSRAKSSGASDESDEQRWCKSLAALYEYYYSNGCEAKTESETEASRQKESLGECVVNKYKQQACPCRWSENSSIVYFAITGLIDADSFMREVESWIPLPTDQYMQDLDSVWQFESIEDDEFALKYPRVVEGLRSGQYNAEHANLACSLLFHFNRERLISIDCNTMIQDAVIALKKRWEDMPCDYINPMLLNNRQEDFLQPIVAAIQEETVLRENRLAEDEVSKFLTALSAKDKETAWLFFPQGRTWLIFDKIVKADKCREFCNLSNWALSLVSASMKDGGVFVRPSSRNSIERIVQEINMGVQSCDKEKPLRKIRLNELRERFLEILNKPEFQRESGTYSR